MVIRFKTPFDPLKKEWTDAIFREYRALLCASLFRVKPGDITYDDLPEDFREQADRHIAMDAAFNVRLKVQSREKVCNTLHWTASYRFRDAEKFQHKQDITLTLHNDASDLPGEISKIAVDFFIYGYFSTQLNRLVECVIVDVHSLKKALHCGELLPAYVGYNNITHQPFATYAFRNLKRLDLMNRHFREINGILVPESIWGKREQSA